MSGWVLVGSAAVAWCWALFRFWQWWDGEGPTC